MMILVGAACAAEGTAAATTAAAANVRIRFTGGHSLDDS